jgi:hypothetical protein
MTMQLDIFSQPTFETASTINVDSIKGQNKKVYDYIIENGSIQMIQAHSIGVMHLHSRISDLRNKNGITIYDRFITVGEISMKEYSLNEFKK